MICELVVKCATLVAVIHALRFVARRAGARASGLLLGLPSSTAVLLILCGREQGLAPAVEMADAGLLGLVAAVALPLAYGHAVRQGWSLSACLAAAVAAYAAVASGLGLVAPSTLTGRLIVSIGSIVVASVLAARIGTPAAPAPRARVSRKRTGAVRTVIPISYVTLAGVAAGFASPHYAGLVSTFPSMSTVVLAVTHLEEGAASAGRIARVLPPANLSTAAFLAAFRLGCPALGLAWGTGCAFLIALLNLAAIEWIPRSIRLPRVHPRPDGLFAPTFPRAVRSWQTLRHGLQTRIRATPRHPCRFRPPHRRHFAPRVEMLPY